MYLMLTWGKALYGGWYINYEVDSGSDYGTDLDCRHFPDRESLEEWARDHAMVLYDEWRRDRQKTA